jgi:hypothetical protein
MLHAARMVRIDRAVRPCLPMTFPVSSGATLRRRTDPVSFSTTSRFTSSGTSTSAFAIWRTSARISSVSFVICITPPRDAGPEIAVGTDGNCMRGTQRAHGNTPERYRFQMAVEMNIRPGGRLRKREIAAPKGIAGHRLTKVPVERPQRAERPPRWAAFPVFRTAALPNVREPRAAAVLPLSGTSSAIRSPSTCNRRKFVEPERV